MAGSRPPLDGFPRPPQLAKRSGERRGYARYRAPTGPTLATFDGNASILS